MEKFPIRWFSITFKPFDLFQNYFFFENYDRYETQTFMVD